MLKLLLLAMGIAGATAATAAPTLPQSLPSTTGTAAGSGATTPAPTPDPTMEPTEKGETQAPTPAPIVITSLNICEEVYGGVMDADGEVCCGDVCDGKCSFEAEVCIDDIPSQSPTRDPTEMPTPAPTNLPSKAPTKKPTRGPTVSPTEMPTKSMAPTKMPTEMPTVKPSSSPTNPPTTQPTDPPTPAPSPNPTEPPTEQPTTPEPTAPPTFGPTAVNCANAGGVLNSGSGACCHIDCVNDQTGQPQCGGSDCSDRADGFRTFGTGQAIPAGSPTSQYCCTSAVNNAAACAADKSGTYTQPPPCLDTSVAGGRRLQTATGQTPAPVAAAPTEAPVYDKTQCCVRTIRRTGSLASSRQCQNKNAAPCLLTYEKVELDITFDRKITNSQPTIAVLADLLSVPAARITIKYQTAITVTYLIELPKYGPLIKSTVTIVTHDANGPFADNLALAIADTGATVSAGGSPRIEEVDVFSAPGAASFAPSRAPTASPTFAPTYSDEDKMKAGVAVVIALLVVCALGGLIYCYCTGMICAGEEEDDAEKKTTSDPQTEMTAGGGDDDDDLPEGWETKTADDGRVYFHYIPTGVTQWTKPKEGDTPM